MYELENESNTAQYKYKVFKEYSMSFVELNCSLCKFDLRQSKHSTGQKTVEVVGRQTLGT